MASRVTVTKDRVTAVVGAINKLVGKQVLVGIPEANTNRTEDELSDNPTNSLLGYVHEFGSPLRNIPARPFLVPGVRKATDQYMPYLRGAAAAALDGKPEVSDRNLVSAGIVAESSAKREISTGNFIPLKPETVAWRFLQRGAKTRRASEERYLELIDQGVSPADAQAAAGIRPLINTGQLRQAITSVVRKK